ncbi:hypothetical protein [Dactylosporangium sp. NPDC005555]|uniref:hypothetical protein n=1 Tax=Dactylosporangium sp. NPDC005555 TaxID=3154889 RepID=UPI0033B517FC
MPCVRFGRPGYAPAAGAGPASGDGAGAGPASGDGAGAGPASGDGAGPGPASGDGAGPGSASGAGDGPGPASGDGAGLGSASGAGGGLLCATHGGVPDAAAVEALVAFGRPSRLWQHLTAVFLAAGAVHSILQVVNIWALHRADAAADTSAPEPQAADAFRLATDIGSAARDGLWAYLLVFLLWFLMISATATRLGLDRRTTLRHWTLLVWRVALVPTLVFAILSGRPSPTDWETVRAVNQNAVAFSAFHLLTTALLMTYVAVVWRRLRPTPLPALP